MSGCECLCSGFGGLGFCSFDGWACSLDGVSGLGGLACSFGAVSGIEGLAPSGGAAFFSGLFSGLGEAASRPAAGVVGPPVLVAGLAAESLKAPGFEVAAMGGCP